ncbi:MAG: hypothetical protein RIM72_06525 [Alphaproteobacteria bacterium]
MNRSLALFAIGVVFGGLAGFLLAAGNGITLDGHDHGEHLAASDSDHTGRGDGMAHDHAEMLVLDAAAAPPTLTLDVVEDPMSGWNLNIRTANFRFAPEHASSAHIAGEGHAHVYVNGVKIARLYGPWMHIGALDPGENVIMVTLNSNDHRTFAIGDTPISAQTTVTVE